MQKAYELILRNWKEKNHNMNQEAMERDLITIKNETNRKHRVERIKKRKKAS